MLAFFAAVLVVLALFAWLALRSPSHPMRLAAAQLARHVAAWAEHYLTLHP